MQSGRFDVLGGEGHRKLSIVVAGVSLLLKPKLETTRRGCRKRSGVFLRNVAIRNFFAIFAGSFDFIGNPKRLPTPSAMRYDSGMNEITYQRTTRADRLQLQRLSADQLTAHQLDRLNLLLAEILPSNKFYQTKFGRLNLELDSLEREANCRIHLKTNSWVTRLRQGLRVI